jgi:hypothetical protein
MSAPRIHFQHLNVRATRVRPLCGRANVLCRRGNSSPLRHEVTCKLCLKRMMALAAWAAEMSESRHETAP